MIEVNSLFKKFKKLPVLKGVEFRIETGTSTAILGPNGSGKTTLMKCILGMVIPNSGSIFFGGKNIIGQYAYRHQIDYLPQIARFPDNLSVSEILKMIKDLREVDCNPSELLELFDLKSSLKKKLRNLSGGTRQKVNIVLSMMFDSPLLIMDEPTTGLDPIALIRFKELVKKRREKGTTILITTHIMSIVEELAQNIIFLLDGRVWFDGKVSELLETYHSHSIDEAIARIMSKSNDENRLKIVKHRP